MMTVDIDKEHHLAAAFVGVAATSSQAAAVASLLSFKLNLELSNVRTDYPDTRTTKSACRTDGVWLALSYKRPVLYVPIQRLVCRQHKQYF